MLFRKRLTASIHRQDISEVSQFGMMLRGLAKGRHEELIQGCHTEVASLFNTALFEKLYKTLSSGKKEWKTFRRQKSSLTNLTALAA